jgi:hypothetical protein
MFVCMHVCQSVGLISPPPPACACPPPPVLAPQLTAPECSVKLSYHEEWILTQCVPIIFAVLFASIYYTNYRNKVSLSLLNPLTTVVPKPFTLLLEYSSLMLSTLTLTYFMVSRSALTVFDCRTLNGTARMVLDADPSVYCDEPGSWQVVRVCLCSCVWVGWMGGWVGGGVGWRGGGV